MAQERHSVMRAIAISRAGGPEVLSLVERPCPRPGDGEVLIAVAAAGINNSDLLQRRGESPSRLPRPDVPGLEVAGHIAEIGKGVEGFRIGDAVCALTNGGGYATHCVVPSGQVMAYPDGSSMVEAAALPEALFTVYSTIWETARLQVGERLLVHGGSSGIGTLAIQMARTFGAVVFATAGTRAKCEACESLGAVAAIDYRHQDFVAEISRLTHGAGVDVILDMVGGGYVMRNVACIAQGGRIVNIAYQQGACVEVDFMELMRRGGSISATMLRPRSSGEKARLAAGIRDLFWPHVVARRIQPVISAVYPLEAAAEAHREFEKGDHTGKIVLAVSQARAHRADRLE